MKKLDFYAQCLLLIIAACLAALSIYQAGYFIVALAMILPIVLWQTISAALLSFSTGHPEHKFILKYYWIFSVICLLLFTGAFNFFPKYAQSRYVMVSIALGVGFLNAFYFLYLYKTNFLHEKKVVLPVSE